MVIPAPPGALLLHVLIKMLEVSAKTSKALGGWPKYKHFEKLTPEIFKMSFFMEVKTSPTLPPYYSIEPMKYALRAIF